MYSDFLFATLVGEELQDALLTPPATVGDVGCPDRDDGAASHYSEPAGSSTGDSLPPMQPSSVATPESLPPVLLPGSKPSSPRAVSTLLLAFWHLYFGRRVVVFGFVRQSCDNVSSIKSNSPSNRKQMHKTVST